MSGLFIHDHIFPRYKNIHYESSGFDNNFIERYQELYSSLGIIARCRYVGDEGDLEALTDKVDYCTFSTKYPILNKTNRKIIQNTIKKYDYITIRLPSLLGIYAVFVCRYIIPKPYILEVVGCPFDSLKEKSIIKGLLYRLIMRACVRTSAFTIYVTEKFLQSRYPNNGISIACSNVTINKVSTIDLENRLNRISQMHQNKHILTVGTCGDLDAHYKRHEDFIYAIPKLQREGYKIIYEIVGGGNTERLQKIAFEVGVLGSVHFLGKKKHTDVFKWLKTIDIYVHPSEQEGLSRAIIEAMSMSLPIIAADSGGIYELIDAKYIFPCRDINKLTEIILSLKITDMENQAKKNFHKAFNYEYSGLQEKRNKFYKLFKLESL